MISYAKGQKIAVEPESINELQFYQDYYRSLSGLAAFFNNEDDVRHPNYDYLLFASAFHSCDSIMQLLEYGRLEAIYAIMRSYYETVILHGYDMAVNYGNYNEQSIKSRLNELQRNKSVFPSHTEMESYLERCELLRNAYHLFTLSTGFVKLKERLSWKMHLNGKEMLLMVNDERLKEQKAHELSAVFNDIKCIIFLHFLLLAYFKAHYLKGPFKKNQVDTTRHFDPSEPGLYSQLVFFKVDEYMPQLGDMITLDCGISFRRKMPKKKKNTVENSSDSNTNPI